MKSYREFVVIVDSQTREDLLRFEILAGVGEDVAAGSAQNFRILRAKGITVRKTIDCLIATFCIREGHSLLHNDRDFHPFERHLGLNVIHAPGRNALSS